MIHAPEQNSRMCQPTQKNACARAFYANGITNAAEFKSNCKENNIRVIDETINHNKSVHLAVVCDRPPGDEYYLNEGMKKCNEFDVTEATYIEQCLKTMP